MNDDTAIIEVPRVESDLSVADLNNSAWDGASAVLIDRYWSGEPAPVARHAEARLLWSSKALHVRFVCNQDEPLVVSDDPQFSTKTMNLWDHDVCEIFIAPDPNMVERYFEFEAAPTGEWLDVAIRWENGSRQCDWNYASQMSSAASVEENRVTIALRIPWTAIHQPQKGEEWRANLFRCVGKDPDRGYLSWQPSKTSQPNFHVPRAFGWLVFD